MFISHLQWQGHGSVPRALGRQGKHPSDPDPCLQLSSVLHIKTRATQQKEYWLNRPCSVWNPPDRRLWFSQAVTSTHPVSPGRGPVGRFVHNQGFPGLHQELQPLPIYYSEAVFLMHCAVSQQGSALGFCERPGRFPLSAATGGENTWRRLSLCLGKCSPPQHREQCENSEPSSQPQYLPRFLKSSGSNSPDDGVAQETDSQGAFI